MDSPQPHQSNALIHKYPEQPRQFVFMPIPKNGTFQGRSTNLIIATAHLA